ncbi:MULTISPECIES: hypothetical protein [unclassified Rickettsia]|uniref:hypothetical protein n=1 Tax=unclassified Rickettsia TaxID=114295 RepID=UPI003132C776
MALTEQQQNRVNTAIEEMRGEIVLLNNYIGRTLYEKVQEIGSIDIAKNENLRGTVKTILGQVQDESLSAEQRIEEEKRIANAGYNLFSTVSTIGEKIKKLAEQGLGEENFNGITNELEQYQKKITTSLSSDEGITSIVNDYIKLKGVVENIGLFEKGGKLVADKRDIITLIAKDISISSEIISVGLKDIKLLEPLQHIATLRTTECFAIDGEQNPLYCVLDREKLNLKENIEKFTQLFNHDIKAFSIIQGTLKEIGPIDIEQNKKSTQALLPTISKLKPEEIQEKGTEIVKNFAPLLESKNEKLAKATDIFLKSIDPAYLAENSKNIAENLQQATKTNLWEKIKTIIFRQDVVGKKLEKVTGEHVLKNNEYVEKEINNKIFSNAIPENRAEIPTEAIRVKQQMQEQLPPPPPPPEEDIPPPPPPKLPNPNKEKKLPPPPPPEVTTGIVQPQIPQVKPVSLPKTPTSTWQQEVINQEKNQRGGGRGA